MRALVVLLLMLSSLSVSAAAFQQQPEQQPKQTDEFVPISQLPAQDQLPAAPLLVIAYALVCWCCSPTLCRSAAALRRCSTRWNDSSRTLRNAPDAGTAAHFINIPGVLLIGIVDWIGFSGRRAAADA
jgi:hypothetical protein